MNTLPAHSVALQSSLKKWGLLCLAWLAFLVTPGHAAQVQSELRTASDDGNLWVVVRNSKVPGEWRLLHHGSHMDGPYARVARTFQYSPKALSASGDRVFVLFDPPLPTMDSMDLDGVTATTQEVQQAVEAQAQADAKARAEAEERVGAGAGGLLGGDTAAVWIQVPMVLQESMAKMVLMELQY